MLYKTTYADAESGGGSESFSAEDAEMIMQLAEQYST
jgi:hypothetical protein